MLGLCPCCSTNLSGPNFSNSSRHHACEILKIDADAMVSIEPSIAGRLNFSGLLGPSATEGKGFGLLMAKGRDCNRP